MKNSINTAIAAIALSTAIIGSAAAATSPSQTLRGTVQSALGGSGQVQVTLNNGVATLSGYVEDRYTELQVERAVRKYPGVDSVINLVVES